ncbi:MAG: DUF4189 domain-containing protein [Oscillatoriales cyanobacterium RM2_1_1]|nr:DUF4189 domain-containing protein [Oscillatoriales cyanobacterium SM2_3_0]NJO45472.1 DUF4189 domain-containing protein [Oscillatoriales cyanobacterium RM2_1_1]
MVTSGLAGNAAWGQWRDHYGAIAADPDGRIWGYAYDYPNREQAERRALEECSRSGSGCQVQVWFKNACGALATNNQGNIGWAWADSRELAETQAVSACSTAGCQVKTWVCTTRYE